MLDVSCPNCGKHYAVPEAAAGRTGKCPACNTVFRVPPSAPPEKETPAHAPPHLPKKPRQVRFPQPPIFQTPSRPRRASRAVRIALIVAAILIITAALVFFILRP
jgi:predicted Zn finger-like uncharacterized protein